MNTAIDSIDLNQYAAEAPQLQWPFVERRRTDRRQSDRRHYSARVRRSGLSAAAISQCTDREQQIVALLLQGLTNKEIARRLGIVEDTVKKHLLHVYNKLGVRRRALIILGGGAPESRTPVRVRRATFVE